MPQLNNVGKVHPAIAALIVIVLVGIVASVAITVKNNQDAAQGDVQTTQNSQQSSSSQNESPTESTDTSTYEDGTYSATGSYISPGGVESIDLTMTIENGVITATELGQNASDGDAQQYQAAFASGYAELIVGKDVNEVSLSRVAGSSLTSNGFNDALDQIKDDARG